MCHATIISATTLPTWPSLICTVYMTSLIILVFYLCNLGPFSISYLEAQVTWNFVYKSLDRFLSSLQLTWKTLGEIPSDFGCWLGDILGRSNIVIGIFCIFLNQYMWHYIICFITYLQKEVRTLFIDELGMRCHRLRQYRRHRGLRWRCIQWRHYSVDAWRHNSVDADAWRRQQRIARKTIGCVPK